MFIVSYFQFSLSSISTSLIFSSAKPKSPHGLTGVGGSIFHRISSLGYISLSSEKGHWKQLLPFALCITLTWKDELSVSTWKLIKTCKRFFQEYQIVSAKITPP